MEPKDDRNPGEGPAGAFLRPGTRRQFMKGAGGFALAVAAGGVLSACGSGTSTASNIDLLNEKASGTIRIGTYEEPAFELLPDKFIPMFEKETGIKVEWTAQDYSTWYEKALNDAQSGTGAFDVFILDDPWMPEFASGGLVLNLTKSGFEADPDFVSTALETAYWPPRQGPIVPTSKGEKSELYAMPILADCPLLCYRKDIYGSDPVTFKRIVEVAEQKGDPSAERYGWVFRGAKGNPVVTAWFPTLYTYGGKFFDNQWNVTFNDPTAVEALEFQLSLLEYCPPNIGEYDSDQEGAAILNGSAFAANLWTGWCGNALNPQKSKVADKLAFGTPPRVGPPASETGIQLAAVSRASKNPAAAAKFVEWFSSKKVQIEFAQSGGTPTRTSAFEDPKAQAHTAYLATVLKTLKVAHPRPRTPYWVQIEEQLGAQLNLAVVEGPGADASKYLDAAAEEAKQTLTQAGYYS
jgi:multiple sugar transport system substrate-binding protein